MSKANSIIQWFIRLIRKDIAEYEVDEESRQRIYDNVMKEKSRGFWRDDQEERRSFDEKDSADI